MNLHGRFFRTAKLNYIRLQMSVTILGDWLQEQRHYQKRMRILPSLLVGISLAVDDPVCPPIEESSFWTSGHSAVDCGDRQINSLCSISCVPPYVSFNPSKPYESWNVQCRKPANPVWTTSKFRLGFMVIWIINQPILTFLSVRFCTASNHKK